jgi:hypothetical protein
MDNYRNPEAVAFIARARLLSREEQSLVLLGFLGRLSTRQMSELPRSIVQMIDAALCVVEGHGL